MIVEITNKMNENKNKVNSGDVHDGGRYTKIITTKTQHHTNKIDVIKNNKDFLFMLFDLEFKYTT